MKYLLKKRKALFWLIIFVLVILLCWHNSRQTQEATPEEIRPQKTLLISYQGPKLEAGYELERKVLRRAIYEKHQAFKEQQESSSFKIIPHLFAENYILLSSLMDNLRQADGLNLQRMTDLGKISRDIQGNIAKFQNPHECHKAPALWCHGKLNSRKTQNCGWGCMIHFAAKCLMVAHSEHRLMLLDEAFFGLKGHFLPLSQTCQNITQLSQLLGDNVTKFAQFDNVQGKTYSNSKYFLPYLPSDLIDKISWLTPDPENWYLGQFVAYLLRPSKELLQLYPRLQMGPSDFTNFALHIRRGDKIQETYHRPVEEYILQLQDILAIKQYSHCEFSKHVFLATDEPEVIDELGLKLGPSFNIEANASIALNASSVLKRFLPQMHSEVVHNFVNLVTSRYLICTFSSNFCRLVYEYKLATMPSIFDLYETISLDLNPFGDYNRRYKTNHHRIAKYQQPFHKDQMIYVHKRVNPVKNQGSISLKGDDVIYFVRSSVSKVLYDKTSG